MALRDCFDETCYEVADMERRVNNYELDWFMLRVRVMFEGKTAEELEEMARPLTEEDFDDLPDEVKEQLINFDNPTEDRRKLQ